MGAAFGGLFGGRSGRGGPLSSGCSKPAILLPTAELMAEYSCKEDHGNRNKCSHCKEMDQQLPTAECTAWS